MPKKYDKAPIKLIKRGETYHLKISTIISGQRIFLRESTHTRIKQEAEEYATKRFAQIAEDIEFRNNPHKLKQFTLDQAFGLFWEEVGQYHANAKDTFNKISNLIKYFNTAIPITNITIDDISDFVHKKRDEGRKPATINRYLALLSAVFNLCKKRRIAIPDVNIREFMQREPAENIYYFNDWETINKILDNSAEHFKPIILMALYTGMRLSNVLGMKWEDIEGNVIHYKVKDKRFEGGRPVVKAIYPAIRELLDSIPKVSEYVFTYKGRPIKSIKKAWKRALERAGIPHERFHILRHTHGTWLYTKTKDLKLTQASLNHTSNKTTMRYVHIVDGIATDSLQQTFGTNLAQNRKTLN